MYSVAFSPDGRRIVSGSYDDTLRIWDAESGAALQRLTGHEGGPVTSVAFSPDGRRIVSGSWDRTLRIWDAESGAELQRLMGHEGPVDSVAFSPDGRRIVSGSWDRTLRIWDAESGAELQRLTGHQGLVLSVAFSPDGRRIVSGSDDNTLRTWRPRDLGGHALQVACRLLPQIPQPDGSFLHDRDVTGLAREIGVADLRPIPPCAEFDPPMPERWPLPLDPS